MDMFDIISFRYFVNLIKVSIYIISIFIASLSFFMYYLDIIFFIV